MAEVVEEVVGERRMVRLADLDTQGLSLRFPDGTELVVTAIWEVKNRAVLYLQEWRL